MAQSRATFISSQLVMGFIILGLGILFALDSLDIIEAREILRLWPAILVVLGIMKLFKSKSTPGRFFGLILTGGGLLLLLDRIEYIYFNFTFSDFIILVLIGLGISLVWSSITSKKKSGLALEEVEDEESYINSFVFMGGVSRKNNSKNFRGGELSAIMGGVEVDLTEADFDQGTPVLNIFAFWGGIEIKVPTHWKIEIESYPILGGIDDDTNPSPDQNNKKLIIRGYAIMGGVEVTN